MDGGDSGEDTKVVIDSGEKATFTTIDRIAIIIITTITLLLFYAIGNQLKTAISELLCCVCVCVFIIGEQHFAVSLIFYAHFVFLSILQNTVWSVIERSENYSRFVREEDCSILISSAFFNLLKY